jgi:hypothetical protein
MKLRLVCAIMAVFVFVGMAMSETYTGFITKVEGDKVTFVTGKFNKDEGKFEKGEPMTLPVAADAKILKGAGFDKDTKKFKPGDPLEGGLKNAMFDKIGKGMFAQITTDADNKKITEIIVGGGKKKNQ